MPVFQWRKHEEVPVSGCIHMVVSQNKGDVPIIGDPKRVALILGNPYIASPQSAYIYFRAITCCKIPLQHVSYSLNSLKGGYIGDYIRNYYRGY